MSGQNRYKIAVLTICLNDQYHPYLGRMVESARKFLLRGHEVDYFSWSDMPEGSISGIKIFPTPSYEWPLPTLNRFHLFLQQEEILKEYDYLLYVDADMEFVGRVGDEILGDGLTCARHPMYAVDLKFIPPYEPNKDSTSYISRPGEVVGEGKQRRFVPLYAAGGFQGGRADSFIKAMKEMKQMIDTDFSNNYIPIWNDETAWNKYLLDNPPSVTLSPSYVYPDSLIRSYYHRVWGRSYVPKLVTITKPFSLTKEGGQALQQILG